MMYMFIWTSIHVYLHMNIVPELWMNYTRNITLRW